MNETEIRDLFEENFEYLRVDGGHSITNFFKEEAFRQVLYYYRKNDDLIRKVTEAEVKLTLPELKTPNGKLKYAIEGVVDIVREGEEVWMYDLKTHERSAIENNKELYRRQLNVYAYIWKGLMGKDLDDTAVISTALPGELKDAIGSGNPDYIDRAMERWDPVIPLGYSEEEIEAMIEDFGRTVEVIENHQYHAPPVVRLSERDESGRGNFATRVCRNCDARYSCPSFREYIRSSEKTREAFRRYFDDYGSDYGADEFIDGNLKEE
jgi:hypothetical protein